MPRRLPLFPLSTVLFPGLLLPLHVFEPRYRRLVEDLLALPDDAERSFGVVAIREGREVGVDGVRAVHEIGCTATLRAVEPLDEGRYDITTVGGGRFRVLGLDDSGPYLVADVEPLPERDGAEGPELGRLRHAVERAFARYRAALQGEPAELDELATSGLEELDLPDGMGEDAALLSYAVAAATVLDLHEKQGLLAAEDVATRLRLEHRLLTRERRVIRALPSLPAVEVPYLPVVPN